MNTIMKFGIAALAVNALVGSVALVRAQSVWTVSGAGTTLTPLNNIIMGSGGTGFITLGNEPPPPTGALYHQVVDIYFDGDGNKVETRSSTHAITSDCHGGRRVEDFIAQDDGHGGVKFAQSRLPGEPATGQKPVTAADKVKAMMAIKAEPAPQASPTALASIR
jgi:hypothetical protein